MPEAAEEMCRSPAAARVVGRNAVLDDGHAGLGHSEAFARDFWPELFSTQSAQ